MPAPERPFSFYILCLLHLLLGINGFGGGLLLLLSPDGKLLGMNPGWLSRTPFENYLLPGILLFLCNGILPLFVLAGLTFGKKWKINPLNVYRDRHWAWTFSLYSGIITIGWIAFQEMMTPSFWLQPVIILIGLAIVVVTMLPGVMRYFEMQERK